MLARLHTFIRDVLRRERSGFIKNNTITEALNSASYDLWLSLILKLRRGEDSILLQPFKGVTTGQVASAGALTVTGLAEYEIVSVESESGGEYSNLQLYLTRNDQEFESARVAQEYEHLLKKDYPFTLVVSDSGKQTLPDDLFKVGDVFYHTYNGNRYEGQILKDKEFVDRKNSYIEPATEEKPIARIVGNEIEIAPSPTGASTYNYILPYVRHNPVVRFNANGSDLNFTFLPSSFADTVLVRWVKPPATMTTSDGAVTYGIAALTITTECDWSERAFSELATRALAYLGISLNNQLIAQLEGISEQGNAMDVNA